MIKIKSTDNAKLYSSWKHNRFNYNNITNENYNYNSISNNFNIILNKFISYKNRGNYYSSIRALIGIMQVELIGISEDEISEFFTMLNYLIDVFDTKVTTLGGWYFYINSEINDFEGMTLQQFNLMFNDNNYSKKFFRMSKLKKISKL